MREVSVLNYRSGTELREPSGRRVAAPRLPDKIRQKRRVILVQTQAENAGAQEITRLLGAALTARGYEVCNIYFFRKSASFDAPPNTFYCASTRPQNPVALLQMLWRLGRHIRNINPDAVLTFQHFGNLFGGLITRLVSRAPVIANQVSSAISVSWPVRWADILMGSLGLFNCITLNSQHMEREYASYPAWYRARIKRVAHGFDDKSLDLPNKVARRRFGLPAARVMLGCAARLHPHKQLDAAIRLLQAEPSWHLALAGQGADEGWLRELAAGLGVSGRLHFVGEIPPQQVADFLAALDVFVFPSRAETFGLAAVEAANAGVPCVVNDLPVLREVLSCDGKPAALFVEASDDAKLAAAVNAILTDDSLRDELRNNAKGLKSRYSLNRMVDEYTAILDHVVGIHGVNA